MNYFKKVEPKFKKIFQTEELQKAFDEKLQALFKRTNIRLKSIEEKQQKILDENTKKSIEINRNYYKWVQDREQKYEQIATENNEASHKLGLQTGRQNSQIKKQISDTENHHKKVVSNAKKLQKDRNKQAKLKYDNFILKLKKEINQANEVYLKNADFITSERDLELEKLSEAYQKDIDNFNLKRARRKEIYELQAQQMRNSREKNVSINNDDYRRIKLDHTTVSIHYNEKIRTSSKLYRENVTKLNSDYQNIINPLNNEMDIIREDVFKKSAKIESAVSAYRKEIDSIEKALHADYEEELHALKDNFDFTYAFHVEKLEMLIKSHETELNNLEKTFKANEKDPESKTSYKESRSILESKFAKAKLALETKLANLKAQFDLDKSDLIANYGNLLGDYERKYLEFEKEHYLKLELLRQNSKHRINLINNVILKHEIEKNHKIFKLGSAYELETYILDRSLSVASASQEMFIKDHEGEKSYIIADFNYQNDMVLADYQIAIEAIDTQTKLRKIKYELDRNFITVKYQLKVQEQMVIRDSLIRQYEFEGLMHKENYKQELYEAQYDFDLTQLNSDYETNIEIKNDQLDGNNLDFQYNLKKLETKNIIAKSEATKEFEITQAKAHRNIEMSKLSLDFYEAFTQDFLDLIFDTSSKIRILFDLIRKAYDNQNLDIERFYSLLMASKEYIGLIEKELVELISINQDKGLSYFHKKIEELTGYRYLNKRQAILNQYAQEETIILEEQDKVLENINGLENDLARLSSDAHQIKVNISGLYKEIQILNKKNLLERWEAEKLDSLILDLDASKEALKLNNRQQAKTEKDIKKTRGELAPIRRKLERLSAKKEKNLDSLEKQVRKDAKIYYQEHDKTQLIFESFRSNAENTFSETSQKLKELTENLYTQGNTVDLVFEKLYEIRNNYFNLQFKAYNNLLAVLLKMTNYATKEQERLVSGFEESYDKLNEYLENTYKASYNFEQGRIESDRQRTELEKKKIATEFEKNLANQENIFLSKKTQTKQKLAEFDQSFSETFKNRKNTLKTIQENLLGVKETLKSDYELAIKKTNQDYQTYLDGKRKDLLNKSYAHARLHRDTLLRASRYNDEFKDIKDNTVRILKEWRKNQEFSLKEETRKYRKSLREIKHNEHKELTNNKRAVSEIKAKFNIDYKEKISNIKRY